MDNTEGGVVFWELCAGWLAIIMIPLWLPGMLGLYIFRKAYKFLAN